MVRNNVQFMYDDNAPAFEDQLAQFFGQVANKVTGNGRKQDHLKNIEAFVVEECVIYFKVDVSKSRMHKSMYPNQEFQKFTISLLD